MKQELQLNQPREKIMRITTAILFVVGIYWALFAWIPLTSPIGALMPRYQYTEKDLFLSIFGALLSATGYWIWLGWLIRSLQKNYLFLSSRAFWMLAAANHLGWMLYRLIPDSFLSYTGRGSFCNIWLVAVFFIAILICVIDPDKDLKTRLAANSSAS